MIRISHLVFICAALAVAARPAAAEPFPDNDLQVIKPEGQVEERASITGKMSWCPPKYSGDSWSTGRLGRAVGSREAYEMWAEAAEHLCEHADDPTWQKQAGYLVQAWMNARNLSQADAEAEIKKKIAKIKEEKANEGREPTPEERFAFSDNSLTPYKPENGADTANLGAKAAWCDKAPPQFTDKWESGRIGRTVSAQYGIDGTIQGALHICQRPNDATWKTEAGYILQKWMNWTHQKQSDAEASLRARIQTDKFTKEHDELCKELEISPEVSGGARALAKAQALLFGCGRDVQPLWQDFSHTDEEIGSFLEVATGPEAELLRVYWLFNITGTPWTSHPLPSKDASENRALLYYAIAQHDFAHIDKAALDKLLSAAPYNDYARVTMNETLSLLKAWQGAYEAATDKLTKGDEDYTNILREAPKKAFAQWDKLRAQWKAELDRSDAFEKKLSSPSHKALKGCSAELSRDVEKLIKSFKLDNYNALVDKLGADPVAGLLLSRLAICDAADGVFGASGALADLIKHGRELRGPRSLAFYTLFDALTEAAKDRPRMLLSQSNLWYKAPSLLWMYRDEFSFDGSAPRDPEQSITKGAVLSTAKVADGLQITFKTQKLTFPEMICTDDTRHPLKIDSNGRIEYYRNCKSTGKMLSQDNTPRPIVIAPALAAGIKPGVIAVCTDANKRAKNGNDFGLVVYTKKTMADKKILTFFGFTL